ncbi:GxxExxY protein [Phycisphaerales bacterium AB-hyl4]|uniref:GxxExxY protein n=1 Tax=Natronomicrosphaera hydrolytica TaxID=3242702 RepID=A0ABV4U670_9BACT
MQRQVAKSPSRQAEPSQEVDELARQVIGAAIEVHRTLGPGFPESVYEEALCVELAERDIPFVRQPIIEVHYKGRRVGEGRLDLWIDKKLIVELKAVEQVLPKHRAQGKANLCATGNELALVINFNEAILKDGIHRVILTNPG